MEILSSALETVKKYDLIKNGESIVIGLSGGADSVTLFHFLLSIRKMYDIKLVAVHVHHGIRGDEAQRDMDFAQKLCEKYDVQIEKYYYNVPEKAKEISLTEEETGRMLRYEAFENTLEKYGADKIAVAHNMNDNAETVFMRLCRGTGIKGLGGIAVSRDKIIRPLLFTSREEIEKYCVDNGIEYITDSTNEKNIYTRNKIRNELLCWIKENLNENIIATVSSCSQIIREENDYLDKVAKKEFENVLAGEKEIMLDTQKLKKLDKVILRRVLRLACLSCSDTLHDVAMKHIEGLTELLYKETGKYISLPNDITAENRYGKLYLYNKKDICEDYSYNIKAGEEIYIKETGKYVSLSEKIIKNKDNKKNIYTAVISCDKINKGSDKAITVRSKKSGDKIYLKGVGNKKLKDFFIDMKIPRNVRNSVPVIAVGDDIAAVMGYRISDKYKAEKNSGENNFYIQIWEENT